MTPIKQVFLTLAAISLLAATPLPAQQAMGPEITISALDNEQFLPHVAYNNLRDQYLVVWHNFWGGNRDIYAQRLDGDGNPLSSFTVSAGTFDRAQPAVAYDEINDQYLVVWAYDFLGDGSDWDLYGRLIPWNGPEPSMTEFPIESASTSQMQPEVAFALAQQEFMVVWSDLGATPTEVTGRRVSLDGTFPINSMVYFSSGASDRTNPDIAYNLARNEYLVTYDLAGVDIWGTRLTAGGTILGGGEFSIAVWSDPESRPAVAACKEGADQYFVVWQSMHSPTNNEVYGRFVSGEGTPGDAVYFAGTTLDEQMADITCHTPTREYLVVYEGEYIGGSLGIFGKLLTIDGQLSNEFLIGPVDINETNPTAVAGMEDGIIVTWEHGRTGTSYQDIRGRRITVAFFSDGFESGNLNAWTASVP